MSDVITDECFLTSKMAEYNSDKVVAFYICHRGWKHAVAETTNISSRSSLRTCPRPDVVHELDDCTHHIDFVLNGVFGVWWPLLKRCPSYKYILFII